MLNTIIDFLKQRDPNEVPPVGFCNPHSYRGYYDEVAFEPTTNVTVEQMLQSCNRALCDTFTGWKGGEYTYDNYTQCWLSHKGRVSGQTITPVLLSSMFGKVPNLEGRDFGNDR